MSRQSKLFDDDVIKQLIDYIKVGNYLGTACAAVGVSESAYHDWLRQGLAVEELVSGHDNEDDLKDRMQQGELVLGLSPREVRCWLFRTEIQQAVAVGEAYAVAMIRTQMPQQWTAAMTFLERRFPSRWRRRDQIDIGEATEAVSGGIDESLLLSDPKAVALIHEALAQASKKPQVVLEAEAVEITDDEKSPEG